MGWMTAAQALLVLEVRSQTLYANVSRGRIRARPDPKDPRRSLYHDADVHRLARNRSGARKTERVASGTIQWGEPILPSALSTVAQGRLWYRGHDAVELAQTQTLEEVACLLWGTPIAAAPPSGTRMPQRPARGHARASLGAVDSKPARPLERLLSAMAVRASLDPPSYGRTPSVLCREAAEVLAAVADALLGEDRGTLIHQRLAIAWGRPRLADTLTLRWPPSRPAVAFPQRRPSRSSHWDAR